MEREEFINAIIQELSRQSQLQPNENVFSIHTGKTLTAQDIYKKLRFDFPILDEQMIHTLLTDVQNTWKDRATAPKYFKLSDIVLENLEYLSNKCKSEGNTNNEDSAKGSKSQSSKLTMNQGLSALQAEILLKWPYYLMLAPLQELVKVLDIDESEIQDNQLWSAVHSRLKVIFLDGFTLSKIVHLPPQLITACNQVNNSNNYFSTILKLIRELLNQIKTTKNHNTNTVSNYLEYLLRYQSKQDLIAWLHHYLILFSDLLSQYPDLLVNYLPEYLNLITTQETSATKASNNTSITSLDDLIFATKSSQQTNTEDNSESKYLQWQIEYSFFRGIQNLANSLQVNTINSNNTTSNSINNKNNNIITIRTIQNILFSNDYYLILLRKLFARVDFTETIPRTNNQNDNNNNNNIYNNNINQGTSLVDNLENYHFLISLLSLLLPTTTECLTSLQRESLQRFLCTENGIQRLLQIYQLTIRYSIETRIAYQWDKERESVKLTAVSSSSVHTSHEMWEFTTR